MSERTFPTLLPPDHPDAPKYWMYEASGVLQPVIKKYLRGENLDAAEIKLMRAYLFQWVSSPVWGPSGLLEILRLRAATIETQDHIERTIAGAVGLGMDPL